MSVFPMVCQRFHSARRIGVVKVLGSTARPLITCWQPMRVRLLQEMAGDVTAWNIQAPCISKMRREPKLAETIHLSIQEIVVLGFCGDLAMQKQLKATCRLLVSYITPCWQQLSSCKPVSHRYPAVASGSWAATSMNGNSINPLPTSMLMANMQDQILGLPKVEGMRVPLARLRYIYIYIYYMMFPKPETKSSSKGRFLWIW